jgi:hypothetical protein
MMQDYGCILTEPEKLSTKNPQQGLQLHFDKAIGDPDNAAFMDSR